MTSPDTDTSHGPALGRVRLHVAYHGASFHGFARNEGVDTVEGNLASALSTILRRDTEMSTAGRTDAGVHARRQVISFDAPRSTDLSAMVRSVNALCAPRISVSDATWVDDRFDARHSATWREYRYTVLTRPEPDPFLVDRAWHVHDDLDIALMNLACDALMGEQDFSAFCRKVSVPDGAEPKSMRRRVFAARWYPGDDGGTVVFEIRANAFCHQMVRSLVGFLVDVGRRRRPPSDTRAVIVSGNRSHGSQVAPPHGLVLWNVGYDGVRVHP